jgi:hypothetical protein
MTRWLETDSLSNQDISIAKAIGTIVADADRLIICDVMVDQLAGSADYVMYVTKQIGGAASPYQILPTTTMTVTSGTAICGQSGFIAVRNGDVLIVYVDGPAGDTVTPDTIVRWFELAALRPTAADRTLDVSAGGEAGVDWANVGSPTTALDLSATKVKTSTDVETDTADIQSRLPSALVGGRMDAIPTGGTVTKVTDPVTPSGGTVALVNTTTTVTNPVGVSGGTVDLALAVTSVINPVSVSGGTVNLADAATSVTNPVSVSGGTVTVVTNPVTVSGGTIDLATAAGSVTNPVSVSGGTVDLTTAVTNGVSLADGAITAAKIASEAIDADALKADAVTEIVTGVLTTAMTESYAADGAAPTLAQALLAIQQYLQERSIAGTVMTVKKLDGSTTALTFTLNDATAPTSVTRAT